MLRFGPPGLPGLRKKGSREPTSETHRPQHITYLLWIDDCLGQKPEPLPKALKPKALSPKALKP